MGRRGKGSCCCCCCCCGGGGAAAAAASRSPRRFSFLFSSFALLQVGSRHRCLDLRTVIGLLSFSFAEETREKKSERVKKLFSLSLFFAPKLALSLSLSDRKKKTLFSFPPFLFFCTFSRFILMVAERGDSGLWILGGGGGGRGLRSCCICCWRREG